LTHQRYFLLWRCAPSSEVRGRRVSHEGGCMNWAVRSSKDLCKGKNQIQAKCKVCGRRPRLEPALITTYFNKEAAENERDNRNNGGGIL
jgi:hypothetical protein